MGSAVWGFGTDEMTVRRYAFDLVPQLPADVDLAIEVLGHATEIIDADEVVECYGPERPLRALAAELVETLPRGRINARAVVDYATTLLTLHLRSPARQPTVAAPQPARGYGTAGAP